MENISKKFQVKCSNFSYVIFSFLFGIPLVIGLYVLLFIPSAGFFKDGIVIPVLFELTIFVLFKGLLVEYETGLIKYRYMFIFQKLIPLEQIDEAVVNMYATIIYVKNSSGEREKIVIPLKLLEIEGAKKLFNILKKYDVNRNVKVANQTRKLK